MLSYTSTPVQEIYNDALTKAGIRLLVKREDLNNPFISGNKWWKLKYNLQEATQQKKSILLTFGGAYSNHIFSTAAAAREFGFKSIGIIRGEETLPLNHTLSFAKNCGMNLQYCSRSDYQKKNEHGFLNALKNIYGDFYLIPEGGSNSLAVKGCAEFAKMILNKTEFDFDYLCLPVGTGGTLAGVIEGLQGMKEIIGFPVLKGADFLVQHIKDFLLESSGTVYENWKLDLSYHFGGYAKSTEALLDFINQTKAIHDLPLDHVYTGKLLWGIMDYVKKGNFKRGSTVMMLHTGGLQGARLF